jgi:hypothetical protein
MHWERKTDAIYPPNKKHNFAQNTAWGIKSIGICQLKEREVSISVKRRTDTPHKRDMRECYVDGDIIALEQLKICTP